MNWVEQLRKYDQSIVEPPRNVAYLGIKITLFVVLVVVLLYWVIILLIILCQITWLSCNHLVTRACALSPQLPVSIHVEGCAFTQGYHYIPKSLWVSISADSAYKINSRSPPSWSFTHIVARHVIAFSIYFPRHTDDRWHSLWEHDKLKMT